MSPQEPDPGLKTANAPPDKAQSMMLTLLPQVPLMLRVAVLHILRISEQSKYWDLRTELVITLLRAIMNPSKPPSLSAAQKLFAKAPAIKGRIWISTYTCPAPPPGDTGIQDAVAKAIDGLWHPKTPKESYPMPDLAPVEAEWTGYRAGATSESRLPDLSQKQLYDEMMKEVKSPLTVLYFHGGAYMMMDPATHRPITKTLAKLTTGRVYSVRYRLAPQHPFPAALLDALQSYLALLYPPPDAFHAPVDPKHIVFAGDSAGGNLSLSLLSLLHHLSRTNTPITLPHQPESQVIIPLPAGAALNSPWLDITHSSPSCTSNAPFDYLPTPHQQSTAASLRPPCPAWPATNPPRKHIYSPDPLIAHPLVSPVMTATWAGLPTPVWVCVGWELLADEARFMVGKMVREGVRVVFEEYEGMPHCFALVFPKLKEGRRCLGGWAGFMKGVVEGGGEVVETGFVRVRARTGEEVVIGEGELVEVTGDGGGEEEVRERVWRRVRAGLVPEEGIAKL